jgi:acetyl esterase/lipase
MEDADAAVAFARRPDITEKFSIDARRIVLGGHSMGGFATAAHARADERPLGVILLDAWNVGATGDELGKASGAVPSGIADEIVAHRAAWNLLPWAADITASRLLPKS